MKLPIRKHAMSSVITSTSHKIIMLLCKWKLYLVCRLAGYAATLSCLPKAGDLPDHTSCIYLSLQMHNQDYQKHTMMFLGLLTAQLGDAWWVITLQKQIGCVMEWLTSEPQIVSTLQKQVVILTTERLPWLLTNWRGLLWYWRLIAWGNPRGSCPHWKLSKHPWGNHLLELREWTFLTATLMFIYNDSLCQCTGVFRILATLH